MLTGSSGTRAECRAGPAWRASSSTPTRALSARPVPLADEPRPGSLWWAVVSLSLGRGEAGRKRVLLVYLLRTKSTFLRPLPPRKESESRSVMSESLWPRGLYSPWSSPGQNAGVGDRSLLQGIFPTQGLNPGLPHWRRNLYQLSHKGSPGMLEWAAYPFSRGSS